METVEGMRCTAFEGYRRIASGGLAEVALKAKEVLDSGGEDPLSIFDDATGQPVEVDFRGTPDDVLARLRRPGDGGETAGPEDRAPRGPGRPRLGVVAREVTLLPRHWEWLNGQPGGASVALRKLVEEARRSNAPRDRTRKAQEATYRFMTAAAGNLPGYEEATRALFAGDAGQFEAWVAPWPADVRGYARGLASAAFEEPVGS